MLMFKSLADHRHFWNEEERFDKISKEIVE
jgi:hypothetical protein